MTENMSLLAALLFSAWTLILLGGIGVLRGGLSVMRVKPANSFAVSGEDVSPFSGRLCRAHANCYENLPVFLGIVLTAELLGQAEVTDPLALWVLAARLAQSGIHLTSTSVPAVTMRFVFFLIQYMILAYWVIVLLTGVLHSAV